MPTRRKTASNAGKDRKEGSKGVSAQALKPDAAKSSGKQIQVWEDDPLSGTQLITRDEPQIASKLLPIKILGPAPKVNIYQPGTAEFRFWVAADALRRSADFWGGIVPAATRFQSGAKLEVQLDRGVKLNASYSREGGGLSFYHDNIAGQVVFTSESPDVVAHEFGHALLDAVRPQLYDILSDEVAAFHESFGDMTAILTALQLPSVRQAVLTETGGRLYKSSRLSRVAEQLGWGIRQSNPDAVEIDCLRNAVNSFFYQDPTVLPPNAPASMLSSAPHSFSRVFTAAFFEALAGMLTIESQGAAPTEEQLQEVSVTMGKMLIQGVAGAPIVSDYLSQVAAHMIEADQTINNGKYREALRGGFVRHGVLSLQAADMLTQQQMAAAPQPMSMAAVASTRGTGGRRGAGSSAEQPPQLSISVAGLGGLNIMGYVADEPRRFGVSSAAFGMAALTSPNAGHSALSFTENLIRRGRVDTRDAGLQREAMSHPFANRTHKLVQSNGTYTLHRLYFDCGLDP